MSRRAGGLIGVWAEQQRVAQRQREGQHQAVLRQQRDAERVQRAYERDVARMQREQRAAYRQQRDADALRRTQELDARVQALEGLLAAGCRAPAFSVEALRRGRRSSRSHPGPWASPYPCPISASISPRVPGPLPGGPRPSGTRGPGSSVTGTRPRPPRPGGSSNWPHTDGSTTLGPPRDSPRYACTTVGLPGPRPPSAVGIPRPSSSSSPPCSSPPPHGPRGFLVRCPPPTSRVATVLDWDLPGYDVVPEAKGVKYLPGTDQEREVPRPVTQRRALYRDVVAQSVLLALYELFGADRFGVLEGVTLNGYVGGVDPATGLAGRVCVASVAVERGVFERLNLEFVGAVECLTGALAGRLSAKPDERVAVAPLLTPEQVGADVVVQGDGEEPDLLSMDPIAFEGLVAQLFQARGLQAVTTQRSNDGGVDVEALDPDPISGGSILVQVKRYRNTVPPSAVRDLFGTVQGAGANKGVLVTTSKFGPGSYTFANGKPLTLISGTELVDLLHQHGLRGRLGSGASPVAAAPTATSTPEADADFNLLGMVWAGAAALDVCALVCANQVLGDEWFVFFNNPSTPDGSVSMVAAAPGDRAAVRVGFDALAGARRSSCARRGRRSGGESGSGSRGVHRRRDSAARRLRGRARPARRLRRAARGDRARPRVLPAALRGRLGLRPGREGVPGRA